VDNALIAFIVAVILMTVAFVYSASLWRDVFAIIVSWVLTDSVFSLCVAGGSGIFIFKPFSKETIFKGKAYLVFLGMIIFSTYLSSLAIDNYMKSLLTSQDVVNILGYLIPWAIIATNIATGLFAFLDFNARFYQRQKQQ
jgi:hypothetical protein